MSAGDHSAPSDGEGPPGTRLEQLAELADALVEQVSAVRDQYERLERALDEDLPGPAEEAGGASPADGRREDEPDPGHVPRDGRRENEPGPGHVPHVHDSARLVAMDMAMSGSTRGDTKAYLREALDIEGGDRIVDEVFDRTEAAQEAAPLHRRLFTRRRG